MNRENAVSSTKGACDEESIAQRPKVKAIHQTDVTPQTPLEELSALDTRIALVPLELDAVAEELQNEVTGLIGQR